MKETSGRKKRDFWDVKSDGFSSHARNPIRHGDIEFIKASNHTVDEFDNSVHTALDSADDAIPYAHDSIFQAVERTYDPVFNSGGKIANHVFQSIPAVRRKRGDGIHDVLEEGLNVGPRIDKEVSDRGENLFPFVNVEIKGID